jgi:hypothetical protein
MRETAIAIRIGIGLALAFLPASVAGAPVYAGLCDFNATTMQFRGTAVEQARCLLRPIPIDAHRIGPALTQLGPFLESHVGRSVAISRERLRALLVAEGLAPFAATVNAPLSRARDNNASAPAARYFVIHDTSRKWDGDEFPPDSDEDLNRLGATYPDGTWIAHSFVNRLGQMLLGYDYDTPWRAVRLERDTVTGGALKGLFLHIELTQPRRHDPRGSASNYRLAPLPGFTLGQYDRLALLYILASVRGGQWLIPGFHGIIDSWDRGAHDDPQNFDLDAWQAALERRVGQLTD